MSDLEEGSLMELDLIQQWEQGKAPPARVSSLSSSKPGADFSCRQPCVLVREKPLVHGRTC